MVTSELWVNGNDAIFNLGAGVVIIGAGGVEASSLQFNTTATIAGNQLNLTGDGNLDANSNEVGTIESIIAGNSGIMVGSEANGTIILAGANTYTGVTSIQNGAWLGVEDNLALGTSGDGTVVEDGATLSLGEVTIADETLQISGSGTASSDGAVHVNSIITQANYNGSITLAADAQIGSAGELVLNGTIDTSDATLTVNATPSGTIDLNGSVTGNGSGFDDNVLFDGAAPSR